MKWIYRLLTVVMLCGALAVPFFINNQEGEPMLSLPKPSDLLPGAGSQNTRHIPAISGSQTVYKWQDKDGVWHYGDTPPTDISHVSTLEVNSNTNLIQGMEVETSPAEVVTDAPQSNPVQAPEQDVLSMDRALNILNEAKAVKGLMEARNEQLNTIVGESTSK